METFDKQTIQLKFLQTYPIVKLLVNQIYTHSL